MDIFYNLSQNLGLSPEMYKKARDLYKEISSNLQNELRDYDPDIFPQGSIKLGTAIRPISGKDEYDLDFVCLLNSYGNGLQPNILKKIIGGALKSNYSDKMEEKDRCWRLCYKDFHIDVLPAIPESDALNIYEGVASNYLEKPIRIPEKGLENYRSSNPKGYSMWFDEKKKLQKETGERYLAEATTEPLPTYENPGTLQSVIQVMKVHRDYMFKDRPEVKPISIIITTLAAECYNGEANTLIALYSIIKNFPSYIENKSICNPVNPKENFADKWVDEPEKHRAFNEWLSKITSMTDKLVDIEQHSNQGVKEIYKIISEEFDNNIVENIINKKEQEISKLRDNNNLKVSTTGIIGSATGTNVKRNTFFGQNH